MRNFLKPMLLNESTDGNAGSGTQSETKPTEVSTPSEKTTEGSGDQFDDLGYPIQAKPQGESKQAGEADKKPEQVKTPEPEAKNVTGYGDEPPVVKEPEPVKPPPPPDVDLGYELKTDGLEAEEVSKLKEFLKTNEVPAKAAQAIAEFRKSEFAAQKARVEAQKAEVEKVKASWYHELKTDPTFGGEKFQASLKSVNKVVEEFMPGTKKMLTERGSMLPPYVMRDLAKLADHLYSNNTKMVQGSAKNPDEDGDEKNPHAFLDEMYS